MIKMDANKVLRSVLCMFLSLSAIIMLYPVFHYIHIQFEFSRHPTLFSSYIFASILSFSLLVGMSLRWIFNIRVTQIYDAMLCYVMGAVCILIAAFFTYGLVLIFTLPTCVLATYLLFWHLQKFDEYRGVSASNIGID